MDLELLQIPTKNVTNLVTRLERREQIAWLEQWLLTVEHPLSLVVKETLVDGMYLREMLIPKGVILTGKIHKRAHVSVITKGDITIVTETGTERIVGPRILIAEPGEKRVGIAHEDTLWTTIHASDNLTIEEAPQALTVRNFEELETPCLSQ